MFGCRLPQYFATPLFGFAAFTVPAKRQMIYSSELKIAGAVDGRFAKDRVSAGQETDKVIKLSIRAPVVMVVTVKAVEAAIRYIFYTAR